MKIMAVAEAKQDFSKAVRAAQKEDVIVTRHGKPVARITGVEGDDFADLLMTSDPDFWAMLDAARRGPARPIEEVRERLGIRPRRVRKRSRVR